MPERRVACRAAFALILLLGIPGVLLAAGEEDLFRQVKIDLYDNNWPAVLHGCDELLKRYPDSAHAAQAAFHRARALAHLPGRRSEAAEAFRDFVEDHEDAPLLVEQAWSNIFSLACEGRGRTSPDCAQTLSEGLAHPSAYVSTLAAIRAGDVSDERVRRKALVTLKRALATQSDGDIRNEILIAILKIDPRQVPPPPAAPVPPPALTAAGSVPAAPSLIRMTIYNKAARRYDLKIDLPVSFAQMLINSLDAGERTTLKDEAKKQGIDVDDIFKAIEKSGHGRLLDVDAPDARYEVWIE
ncbi:MAG TPA: hypothetical protein VGQ67_01215 [Candidatus Polarisedimenticolia bacterium]|nr:hypothetical protein [Candidatus Polarisedimenticolia bacterium]